MYSDGKYRCIEDELPFELPNGWKMCTYGNLKEPASFGCIYGCYKTELLQNMF